MSIKSIFDYITHGFSHVLYADPNRIDITISQFDEECSSILEKFLGSQS